MKNLRKIFTSLLLSLLLFAPSLTHAAKEHAALMLKSTSTKRVYYARPGINGAFKFHNVKPGTYILSLIAPKDFFTSNSVKPILLQNLVWNTVGYKAVSVTNMTLPDIVVTKEQMTSPVPSSEKGRPYSVILNPSLTTAGWADLSGIVTNFPKGEY
jgi:hypothetical protein